MYAKEMVDRIKNGEDALELSIEKWKDIVNHLKSIKYESDYDYALEDGDQNCALCFLYRKDGCAKCPVYKFTGYQECNATPYVEFSDCEYEDFFFSKLSIAKEELEFLKSLRNYED